MKYQLKVFLISKNQIIELSSNYNFQALSPDTLEVWRHYNRGPRFIRISGRIFYEPSAVDKFCTGIQIETEDSLQLRRAEG